MRQSELVHLRSLAVPLICSGTTDTSVEDSKSLIDHIHYQSLTSLIRRRITQLVETNSCRGPVCIGVLRSNLKKNYCSRSKANNINCATNTKYCHDETDRNNSKVQGLPLKLINGKKLLFRCRTVNNAFGVHDVCKMACYEAGRRRHDVSHTSSGKKRATNLSLLT